MVASRGRPRGAAGERPLGGGGRRVGRRPPVREGEAGGVGGGGGRVARAVACDGDGALARPQGCRQTARQGGRRARAQLSEVDERCWCGPSREVADGQAAGRDRRRDRFVAGGEAGPAELDLRGGRGGARCGAGGEYGRVRRRRRAGGAAAADAGPERRRRRRGAVWTRGHTRPDEVGICGHRCSLNAAKSEITLQSLCLTVSLTYTHS
mmetsp:Transcript_16292/g.52736  ORF Transcript_16292/g.52736 Transcript_16292/m.52736 type:complete len:209 (+) Transcript_16292:521-1147(+)